MRDKNIITDNWRFQRKKNSHDLTDSSALNLLLSIYTAGWRETLWALSVLTKNTTQCTQPELNPRRLDTQSSALANQEATMHACYWKGLYWLVYKHEMDNHHIYGVYIKVIREHVCLTSFVPANNAISMSKIFLQVWAPSNILIN